MKGDSSTGPTASCLEPPVPSTSCHQMSHVFPDCILEDAAFRMMCFTPISLILSHAEGRVSNDGPSDVD